MNDSNNLKPEKDREFGFLTYVAEKMQNVGVLEDVSDLLFYDETKELFDRIKKGENVSIDPFLPDSFTMGYLAEAQFDATKVYLSDLKGRREVLNEKLKEIEEVYNFDVDYSSKNEVQTMRDLVNASLDQVINNPRGMFPNKWNDFYSVIGGFLGGELIGIAGGSGSGKTTFAIEMINSLQDKYKCKSGFMSCEMGDRALGKKLVKRSMLLSTKGYIHQANTDRSVVDNFDFGNWDNCSFHHKIKSLNDVRNFVTREKPHFWILDHIAMIPRESGFSSGDWAVHLTNALKSLCKETGTIGFCLFQLDKDSQKRSTDGKQKIPTLADIYGGIGSKMALDTGIVTYEKNGDHFVYLDKVRDYYDETFRSAHFKSNGDSITGEIHSLIPQMKDDGFRIPD